MKVYGVNKNSCRFFDALWQGLLKLGYGIPKHLFSVKEIIDESVSICWWSLKVCGDTTNERKWYGAKIKVQLI